MQEEILETLTDIANGLKALVPQEKESWRTLFCETQKDLAIKIMLSDEESVLLICRGEKGRYFITWTTREVQCFDTDADALIAAVDELKTWRSWVNSRPREAEA